jgi:AcrR family transcriptional regulator
MARPGASALVRQRAAGSVERGSGFVLPAGVQRAGVSDIQRSRLLAGAAGAIEEYGYAGTTVAHITGRAGVSRRTFYELFANCEECLAALVKDVVEFLEGELRDAGLEGLAWRERVRGGLLAILSFCDREPALARVCVVHAGRGGPLVLAQREALLARLVLVLDAGRKESQRAQQCGALTAEGLVGAALAIVYARLSRNERKPLVGLLGELMGMIVLPYQGPAAARSEQTRPAPKPITARRSPGLLAGARDPLQNLPMRVTYRTARVLQGISEQPGGSNRELADYAGIHDQGQISKLLARLERLGLILNGVDGHERGEPNAWNLTPIGEQVAQRLNLLHENGAH